MPDEGKAPSLIVGLITIMFYLSITGNPTLTGKDGQQIRLPGNIYILAAILLVTDKFGEITRDRAGALLWEDADSRRRSGNIRQLLARLNVIQKEYNFTLFSYNSDKISIEPKNLAVDAAYLLDQSTSAAGRRIIYICKIYRGLLLQDIYIKGDKLSALIQEARMRLQKRFLSLVNSEIENSIAILSRDETINVARHILDVDARDEIALSVLLRMYLKSGDSANVEQYSSQLEAALRNAKHPPKMAIRTLLTEVAEWRSEKQGKAAGFRRALDDGGISTFPPAISTGKRRRFPRLLIATPPAFHGIIGSHDEIKDIFGELEKRIRDSRNIDVRRSDDIFHNATIGKASNASAICDYVIKGDFTIQRGAPAIVYDLTEAATDETLWAAHFELKTLSSDQVDSIAEACLIHIENRELRTYLTTNNSYDSYRATLHANRLLRELDLVSIRRARKLLRSTLNLDPSYAPALAALSKSFRLEALRLGRGDTREFELAVHYARSAIAADPDSIHGYHQLGIASIYRKEFDLGLHMLDKSTAIFPAQQDMIADHADALISAGIIHEGLLLLAPFLESRAVPSDFTLIVAACGQFLLGRYREALQILSRQSLTESSTQLKAACHGMLSEFDEARTCKDKTLTIIPDFSISKRLKMAPLLRKEDIEHYRYALILAGFT
jgi:DNA-binding SARP family transcriptional activator